MSTTVPNNDNPRKLLLVNEQSPGDIVMLTAAVRDLHKSYPGCFVTDVCTAASDIWENNPYITKLSWSKENDTILYDDDDLEVIECSYPLIHRSNAEPYHFIHGFAQFLEERLGISIHVSSFKGDIYLSKEERKADLNIEGIDNGQPFWIIVAGGKTDFTAKWWDPARYQKVVNHFKDNIKFVQCGECGDNHWHVPLENTINLLGKTNIRQFIKLVHHSDGIICPVTFAMHLAAAVESRPGAARTRACVVVAGGREPPHWEAYPNHQYIHSIGALECCDSGGCWKDRCQLIGDGDPKDLQNRCVHPVYLSYDFCIPGCMDMITADDVIRRIEFFR